MGVEHGKYGREGTVCFAESTNISRIHIGGHRKRLQVLSSQPRSLDKQKYLISLLAGRGILAGEPNKETCSTKHFLQLGSAKKKKEQNLLFCKTLMSRRLSNIPEEHLVIA